MWCIEIIVLIVEMNRAYVYYYYYHQSPADIT